MRIIVVMGGPSSEAGVSYKTAENISKTLNLIGHEVFVCDLLYSGIKKFDEIVWENYKIEIIPELSFINDITNRRIMIENLMKIAEMKPDIVFNATHGKFGEDGHLSAMFEMLKLRYTGSNQLSSSMALDKDITKKIITFEHITTPAWLTFCKCEHIDEIMLKIRENFNYPFVVKPNSQGSTIGLTIVKKYSDLQDALELAFRYDDKIIVEKYIKGRELTVSVLGREVLPILEIIALENNYDYQAKYISDETKYIFPTDLPKGIEKKLIKNSLLCMDLLGINSYARLDYIYNEELNDVFFLEINVLPGMTGHSLFPKAAKKRGYTFEYVLEKIMELSINA